MYRRVPFLAKTARQVVAGRDGLRGLAAVCDIPQGDLIASVPLRMCYFPLLAPSYAEPQRGMVVRKCNRGKTVFPEFWMWLHRFYPLPAFCEVVVNARSDQPREPVSLSASVSLSSEQSRGAVGEPTVLTVSVSPVEAALTACVALRYFYETALNLSLDVRASLRVGPWRVEDSSPLADRLVRSFPLRDFLDRGVEALYTASDADGIDSEVHSCLEQVCWNMRDHILLHASANEYRLMDENAALFDSALLASLYVVRARVVPVRLLREGGSDGCVDVFAPVLDLFNHDAASPSCAAALSLPQQVLVVRSLRAIRRGEPLNISYDRQPCPQKSDSSRNARVFDAQDLFESRYLFNAHQL